MVLIRWKKCPNCGTEFQSEKKTRREVCDECKSSTVQRRGAKKGSKYLVTVIKELEEKVDI